MADYCHICQFTGRLILSTIHMTTRLRKPPACSGWQRPFQQSAKDAMISIVLDGFVLVVLTIWTHAAGIALLAWSLTRRRSSLVQISFWTGTLILHRMIWLMIVLHVSEITIWALFFWWKGAMPSAREAFYFSGVTYTTVGYGDVVLETPWRLLAPIEALLGVLMCGLSTGFFLFLVSRINNLRLMQEASAATKQKTEA
jgi:Ion channel